MTVSATRLAPEGAAAPRGTAAPSEETAGTGSRPIERADVVVIGAGIIGLATALRVLERRPDLRVAVLEKESTVAAHQTGHNSGVLHAGLYYEPGSLKARLCREGKADLEAYCEARDIPVRRTGKLVVALDEGELDRFEALRDRAVANEVPGLEEVGPERMRELEPNVAGIRALWSPGTAVVDFRRVARAFARDIVARGGTIETRRGVTRIRQRGDGVVVDTEGGEVVARWVIACAGLQSDRVAAMTGQIDIQPIRIVPFRGDYYSLTPAASHLVNGLIYPVPDPRFPFLGVHLTKTVDGGVLAGPNAVLATAREGYGRTDLSLRDVRDAVTYRGFLRLARTYWRTGVAEMWRDWSKRAFLADLRRYLPALTADSLVFGPSGVRAQALRADGTLVDDFTLAGSDRVLHVLNAPSPAATASLAIGRVLVEEAAERFDL